MYREDLVTKVHGKEISDIRRASFQITVRRFFTNVDGVVLPKTSGLIPNNLKTDYPVYFFMEYDREGGYKILSRVNPVLGGAEYLFSYVDGVNVPFLQFTGLQTIHRQIKTGDIVLVYVDDSQNPNFYIWIVLSTDTFSIASLVGNSIARLNNRNQGLVYIDSIGYLSDNTFQYEEGIDFVKTNILGEYTSDNVSPNIAKHPNVALPDKVTLPVNWWLNQYTGMATKMLFETDEIALTMNLKVPFKR